jgi:hypothetical protein
VESYTVFGVCLRKYFCSFCQWRVLLKSYTDSVIRVSRHWVRNVSDLCVPSKEVDLTYQTCSHIQQDTADKTGGYCCRQLRREFRLNVKHNFIFLNVYFRSDWGVGGRKKAVVAGGWSNYIMRSLIVMRCLSCVWVD